MAKNAPLPNRNAILFQSINETAEHAVPMGYISIVRTAKIEQRRQIIADFTHLCDPYVASVPDMFEKALTGLMTQGVDGHDVDSLMRAAGVTVKNDSNGNAYESALGQFRRFGAAIGRPPGLPKLMEAEIIIKKSCDRMLHLASSNRFGVAVGALTLSDYLWSSLLDHLGIILRDEPMVRPVDIGFFAVERIWTNNGRQFFDLATAAACSPEIERSIRFGVAQATVIQKDMFDLLENRARLLSV